MIFQPFERGATRKLTARAQFSLGPCRSRATYGDAYRGRVCVSAEDGLIAGAVVNHAKADSKQSASLLYQPQLLHMGGKSNAWSSNRYARERINVQIGPIYVHPGDAKGQGQHGASLTRSVGARNGVGRFAVNRSKRNHMSAACGGIRLAPCWRMCRLMRAMRRSDPLDPLKQNERVKAGDQRRPPT